MSLERQVPSMLVLRKLPTFLILSNNISGYEDQMKALRTARNEVANIRAEQTIRRATKHNTPPAAHYNLKSGDKVYT